MKLFVKYIREGCSVEIGGEWLGVFFCPPTCMSWSQNNRNQKFAMQLPKLMSYAALVMVAWRKFVTSPPFLISQAPAWLFSWSRVRAQSQVTRLLSLQRSNKDAIRLYNQAVSGQDCLAHFFTRRARHFLGHRRIWCSVLNLKRFLSDLSQAEQGQGRLVHCVSTLTDLRCHLF